jgi:hypothetical protein
VSAFPASAFGRNQLSATKNPGLRFLCGTNRGFEEQHMRNTPSVSKPQDAPPAGDLDDLALRVRDAHAATHRAACNLLEHAMAAGDALNKALSLAPEGGWENWIKQRCEISLRTAQVYMQLSRGRAAVEAQRAAPMSLRGALAVLKREQPGTPPAREAKKKTAKTASTLGSLAWAEATQEQRQRFLGAVGQRSLLSAVPGSWDLQGGALRATPIETILAELKRRQLTARQQKALRALTATFPDLGPPTIDLKVAACADSPMTPH